jgi:hypothetical protein
LEFWLLEASCYHAANRLVIFCSCCFCGHVGNVLALSIMSTALLSLVPRQTDIGVRYPSA